MATYYVGLDVHLRHTTMCILDRHGKRTKRRTIRGPWTDVADAIRDLSGKVSVCFEASTAYGYLYELLSDVADRVVVAHPGHLRLIFRSKQKNDRADAEKLAKLLFLDEVPPVYVPSCDVRSWRQLIEYRRRQRQRDRRLRPSALFHRHRKPSRWYTARRRQRTGDDRQAGGEILLEFQGDDGEGTGQR